MILPTNYPAIHPLHARRRPLRWIVLLTAAGAATVVMVTGCQNSRQSQGMIQYKAAQKALKLAASRSQDVSTLTASLSERSSGIQGGSLTGTIQVQLKPTTLIAAQFDVPVHGSSPISLQEIMTNKALYFKDPAFAKQTGKAWVTVQLAHLTARTGLSLASLLQNLEGSNPLAQTRLLTASRDVKAVGTKRVNGIATTEYVGSYLPATAYAQLPPELRKMLGPTLRAMGSSPVRFQVWIDAQHMIRMAQVVQSLGGQTFTSTFNVISIDKPVKITLPAAGQVAPLPKI